MINYEQSWGWYGGRVWSSEGKTRDYLHRKLSVWMLVGLWPWLIRLEKNAKYSRCFQWLNCKTLLRSSKRFIVLNLRMNCEISRPVSLMKTDSVVSGQSDRLESARVTERLMSRLLSLRADQCWMTDSNRNASMDNFHSYWSQHKCVRIRHSQVMKDKIFKKRIGIKSMDGLQHSDVDRSTENQP